MGHAAPIGLETGCFRLVPRRPLESNAATGSGNRYPGTIGQRDVSEYLTKTLLMGGSAPRRAVVAAGEGRSLWR